jgi:hypothetical protein
MQGFLGQKCSVKRAVTRPRCVDTVGVVGSKPIAPTRWGTGSEGRGEGEAALSLTACGRLEPLGPFRRGIGCPAVTVCADGVVTFERQPRLVTEYGRTRAR